MNRIEEKVKDIVEVRPYGSVVDFRADLIQTVTSYHFTDITADLMSKWLIRAGATGEGNGSASALAGFRGVGKSHFLATLGVLLGVSDLRVRIQDPIVDAATRSLQRRQFAVAYVRRGTGTTLLEEIKEGLAPVIGQDVTDLSNTLSELLMLATMNTAGEQVAIIIDTALERTTRVSRDDGLVLAEVADIAKQLGIFVAIALDDDIAGADGANSGIAAKYSIDYLDQEHLYKIVDTRVFPKSPRMLPVLHDIFQYYRKVIPGFRWSEQRFTSLYPLHPSIMEIAPFVRLYLQEFALLGFASEAGARILGRPANSLIAPDEVFDNVELGLRSIEELSDVFAAFDKLNTNVVAKTPVMKRLQAKLVLKGLLLFSLNEGGASASEISASMLIFDENNPDQAVSEVEATLLAFANALPDSIEYSVDNAGVARFSFRLAGKDDLRSALSQAAPAIGDPEIREVLRRVMGERYSDCEFNVDQGRDGVSTESFVVWRGANRPGLIHWGVSGSDGNVKKPDWEITINTGALLGGGNSGQAVPIEWRPAPLTSEEKLILQRLAVLTLDAEIRNEFKEHIAAAIQAHTVSAEKVFVRSFLIDGVLAIDGLEYNFSEEARTSQSLSQISTVMLESLFEGKFPMHPYFPQVLRMREVSSLVSDFFSGAQTGLDESQWLASTFAVQLDLAAKIGDKYAPVEAETLQSNPLVQQVMELVPTDGAKCDLPSIFELLARPPYGLVNEASYLLLAGMASARLIEFVTNTGDRISRRSFDLNIIWDDIVGVSRPVATAYSNARLMWWAAQICGTRFSGNIEDPDVRRSIADGLAQWLKEWEATDLDGQFAAVNDSQINAKLWRLSSISLRSFSVVADSIRAQIATGGSLETCLERVADIFSDSETEIIVRRNEIELVKNYLSSVEARESAKFYLALCEFTGDAGIDSLRNELIDLLDRSASGDLAISADEISIKLDIFRRSYCDHYSEHHDAAVRSRDVKDKISEIRDTGIWREFESVSDTTFFDPSYQRSVREILQRISYLDCQFDAGAMAAESGSCGCRFSLCDANSVELLPNELWASVNRGLSDFRNSLLAAKNQIIDTIADGIEMDDPELVEGAKSVRKTLLNGDRFGGLRESEVRVLHLASDRIVQRKKVGSLEANAKAVVSPTPEWADTVTEIGEMLDSFE